MNLRRDSTNVCRPNLCKPVDHIIRDKVLCAVIDSFLRYATHRNFMKATTIEKLLRIIVNTGIIIIINDSPSSMLINEPAKQKHVSWPALTLRPSSACRLMMMTAWLAPIGSTMNCVS